MSTERASDFDLFEATKTAVRNIGGPKVDRLVLGLDSEYENGTDPDFNMLANELGVALDDFAYEFSKALYARTGDILVPEGLSV